MGFDISEVKLFDIDIGRFKTGKMDADEVAFVKKMTFTLDKRVMGNLSVLMRRLCYLVMHGAFFGAQAEADRLQLDKTVSSIQETYKPWIDAAKKSFAEKFAFLSSSDFQKNFGDKQTATVIKELENILNQSKLAREALSNINPNAPEIQKLDGINEELTTALKFLKEYAFNQLMKKQAEGLKGDDVESLRNQLKVYANDKNPDMSLRFWKSVNEMIPEKVQTEKKELDPEAAALKEWNRRLSKDELLEKMRKAQSERDQKKS